MVPDSFGSCLVCCLEYTTPVVTTLTKSECFKGNPASLAIAIPPGLYSGCFFYAFTLLYLLKGQLLDLTPKKGHQLPDCQGVSVLYEFRIWKIVECFRLL